MEEKRLTITYEKALERVVKQCSIREVCVFDARAMLNRWGASSDDIERVLEWLVVQKFIDDERYAAAYVQDKSRFGNWGSYKIRNGLRLKKIDSDIIDRVVEEFLDMDLMNEKIEREISRKASSVSYKDLYDLKNKLMRFALSRGYEMESAEKCVGRICRELKDK